jgi:hypothetical protein
VAATSSVTSPTVAGVVRYWVVFAAAAPRPPNVTARAAIPTATSTTSASSLRFIRLPSFEIGKVGEVDGL